MVRDALGPLAVFFAGWKLVGLAAGISSALVFGLAVLLNERRQGRQAALVRVTLALVCLRAIGSHFIAADHGAHSRAEILQLTLKRLLA